MTHKLPIISTVPFQHVYVTIKEIYLKEGNKCNVILSVDGFNHYAYPPYTVEGNADLSDLINYILKVIDMPERNKDQVTTFVMNTLPQEIQNLIIQHTHNKAKFIFDSEICNYVIIPFLNEMEQYFRSEGIS